MNGKLNRNDPCSCGSGRKYKQCCMQRDAAQPQQPRALPVQQLLQQGVAHHQAGRLPQAEALYQQILQAQPQHAEALHLLGMLACQYGNFGAAIELIGSAIQQNPLNPAYHSNFGLALVREQRFVEAVESYGRAIELKADAAAYNNLGCALQALQRYSEAIGNFRKAIALQPNYAEARSNLAEALLEAQRRAIDTAVREYRKPELLMPEDPRVFSDFLLTSQYDPACSAEQLYADHCSYAERFEAPWRARWPRFDAAEANRKLVLGFVSGDFSEHPVGYFIEGVLAQLDRERFDIVLYSARDKIDALTERLRALPLRWVDLHALDDTAAFQRIRADAIDILVDLSGHTAHNRLPLFARKPAPVQVSWLGYWATTGLQAIDYILCDAHGVPPGAADRFVETPWPLPDTRLCFTPPALPIPVGPLPALANGYITFGCFSSLAKLNHAVIALWSRLLQAVPQSRLLLMNTQFGDADARTAMLQRFAAHGIGAERIALEGPVPRAEYFAAYQRIDIALDPFPFAGGTTSIEGLWMGVPLVTLRGGSMIARQGEGFLRNLDLADWIAASADDYVDIARAKADDSAALAALRGQLRGRLLRSPLCNAPAFADNLAAAFAQMWQRHCRGEHSRGGEQSIQ